MEEEIILFEEQKPASNPLDKYRNVIFLSVVILLLGVSLALVLSLTPPETGLIINEVVLSNSGCLEEASLGTPDWLELYNSSDHAISLSGYGLSTHSSTPYLFTFPEVTIEAGEYLIIYFAGDTDLGSSELICTGYTLSRSGETVYLSSNVQELLEIIEVPALESDMSYARRDDGSYGYCLSPTPGRANTTEIVDDLA
ncbi:MAG: lamin tail domain-containing protein [Clostridia bacterium]|nr:lamin tail domain-containing protein [Clostridia bacterium]